MLHQWAIDLYIHEPRPPIVVRCMHATSAPSEDFQFINQQANSLSAPWAWVKLGITNVSLAAGSQRLVPWAVWLIRSVGGLARGTVTPACQRRRRRRLQGFTQIKPGGLILLAGLEDQPSLGCVGWMLLTLVLPLHLPSPEPAIRFLGCPLETPFELNNYEIIRNPLRERFLTP